MEDKMLIGRKPILDALKEYKGIEKVWIDAKLKGPIEKDIRSLTSELKIPLQYVPREKLTSLASNGGHQGVVAQLSIVEYSSVEELVPQIFESGRVPALLILDGIEDVRNIGALARSAVWFDMDAIVVFLKRSARINSFTYKTSVGAIMDIAVCRESSIIKTIDYLKASGIRIIVTDGSVDSSSDNIDFKEPIAIVLGSEGRGVVREVKQRADATYTISGSGRVESLNVSVAGAVIMHELFKERTNK